MHGNGRQDATSGSWAACSRRCRTPRSPSWSRPLAITGIVPLSGFFSKDAILGNALFSSNHALGWVGPTAYALGALAALCTAFYMTRLIFLDLRRRARAATTLTHAHESSPIMTVPLVILAFLAVVAAGLELPLPGQWGHVFKNFTARVFEAGTQNLLASHHFHVVHDAVTGVMTEAAHPSWPYFAAWVIALVGTIVAWALYLGPLKALPARLMIGSPNLCKFAYEKFYVDELYEYVFINPLKLRRAPALARGGRLRHRRHPRDGDGACLRGRRPDHAGHPDR